MKIMTKLKRIEWREKLYAEGVQHDSFTSYSCVCVEVSTPAGKKRAARRRRSKKKKKMMMMTRMMKAEMWSE